MKCNTMKNSMKSISPWTVTACLAVTAVFVFRCGLNLTALRYILFCWVLIAAGACDAATREIPDSIHVAVLFVGLMGLHLLPALAGLLIVSLPFLIAALMTDGKIGGGDVKLMAASGFVLGVSGGITMMLWGLFTALVWNAAFGKGQKSLPLAPFLAFGGFMALLNIS